MKKITLALIALIGIISLGYGQVNPHTIGLRFGGSNYGSGIEVSYQHGLGETNRLELNLGVGSERLYSRVGVSGIYHWVFPIQDNFNWYVGPGAQLWSFSYKSITINGQEQSGTKVGLAVGGQIGLEYDFIDLDVPFTASIDTRPMFNLVSNNNGFDYGLAITLRYKF